MVAPNVGARALEERGGVLSKDLAPVDVSSEQKVVATPRMVGALPIRAQRPPKVARFEQRNVVPDA